MKIAIQGHPTRGNEVIQILETLGGNNLYIMTGSTPDCAYYINSCYNIDGNPLEYVKQVYPVYTLEEFEKEFPFKIGDRIRDHSDDEIGIILGFIDIDDELMYVVDFEKSGHANMPAEELKHYKEMKEERNITLTLDKAKEWYQKGGELKEVALQAYSEKELTKAELPKTWEEFCDNNPVQRGECFLSIRDSIEQAAYSGNRRYKNWTPSKKSAEAHLAMIQLEQLRDCYRGLFVTVIGMPVWCIVRYKGKLIISHRTWGTNETFLSFQSPEIAEKYLENFELLIKQAGDLI